MEAGTIINQLTTSNGLPRAALAAAAGRRKELAPLFVAAIESYLSGGDAARHSTATELADESVDMRKIQKMPEHKNIKTTRRDIRETPSRLSRPGGDCARYEIGDVK